MAHGTVSLSVRVPWEVKQKLQKIAGQRGLRINDLLQEAIHEGYFEKSKQDNTTGQELTLQEIQDQIEALEIVKELRGDDFVPTKDDPMTNQEIKNELERLYQLKEAKEQEQQKNGQPPTTAAPITKEHIEGMIRASHKKEDLALNEKLLNNLYEKGAITEKEREDLDTLNSHKAIDLEITYY